MPHVCSLLLPSVLDVAVCPRCVCCGGLVFWKKRCCFTISTIFIIILKYHVTREILDCCISCREEISQLPSKKILVKVFSVPAHRRVCVFSPFIILLFVLCTARVGDVAFIFPNESCTSAVSFYREGGALPSIIPPLLPWDDQSHSVLPICHFQSCSVAPVTSC